MNIGDDASRIGNAAAIHRPLDTFFNILERERKRNKSVRMPNRRGVHLKRVPSSVAVVEFPDAFWIAAAA